MVDGDDHRQLAVDLLPRRLREVGRAFVFHTAAQVVVVDGVHRFTCGGAHKAFFGPGVFFHDAPLNLGQQLEQLFAFFFLRLALGGGPAQVRVGQGQGGNLVAHLRQQLGLLLLHGVELALLFFHRLTQTGHGGVGQGCGGPALVGVTATCQRKLGNGLGFVGGLVRLGVHQNHLQRGVLEDAVKRLGVHKPHREQRHMQRCRHTQRQSQRAQRAHKGAQSREGAGCAHGA